jgi:hypothetical protein
VVIERRSHMKQKVETKKTAPVKTEKREAAKPEVNLKVRSGFRAGNIVWSP